MPNSTASQNSAAKPFSDNAAKNRFEYAVDNDIVIADYRRQDTQLYITHVEAPEHLRGTGAASKLMTELVAHAKQHHLTIVPVCSYAAAWIKKHAGE